MSNGSYNDGYNNTQRGNQTPPQKPDESAIEFQKRTAGADQARKDRGW